MKTMSTRARALACALLAGTAYCALAAQPAAAQGAPGAPPPTYRNVDGNGVDLVTGRLTFSLTEAVMGSGDGMLALVRHWTGSGAFVDNWSSGLYAKTVGGVTTWQVQLGDLSDSFTQSGSSFVSTKGDGSTLVENNGQFLYTAGDGTTIEYLDAYQRQGYACPDTTVGRCYTPIAVTRPNGMKFDIKWTNVFKCTSGGSILSCPEENLVTFYRFRGVTSSAGYSFTVNYATNGAGTFSAPVSDWYRQTGVSFSNSVAACSGSCPSIAYSSSGGIITVTDAESRQWRFDTSTTQLTGIRRPGEASDTTAVTYGAGAVVTRIVNEGVATDYWRSVDTATNMATTTITSPAGQRTVVADLSIGRITSVTDEVNRTTTFGYAGGRLTRVTAPEGNFVQYTYDGRGNVTEVRRRDKAGNIASDIVTSASYDSSCANPKTCNQPNSVTDERSKTTAFAYSGTHGGVLTATAPEPTPGAAQPQLRYAYTLVASPVTGHPGVYLPTETSACQTSATCAGTAEEVKSTIGYGNNLLPIAASTGASDNSLVAATSMTYDPAGNLLTVDGPLPGAGDTIRLRYNHVRERIGTVSADPDGVPGGLNNRAQRVTIDGRGLVTKVETGIVPGQSDADWASFSSAEEVQTDYDAHARPVKRKLVAGGTIHALTQAKYDSAGRVDCVVQRMNPALFGTMATDACSLATQGGEGPDRIVRSIYDAASQVLQVKTAYGTGDAADEVTTTYTGNGLVKTVTDGENNKTTYDYDGHDRLQTTYFPNAAKGSGVSSSGDYEQWGYDPAGNVTSFRTRSGDVIVFTYDALGRMTFKDRPGTEPDVAYAFDLLGRLTGTSQTGLALGFTYDALGRTLTETSPLGTMTSAWDVAGRRTRLTWPDTFYVTYDYLVTGEMTAIRENGATSGPGVLATFGYDQNMVAGQLGLRTSLMRGNGAVTTYEYDAVSRLARLTQDLGGADTSRDLTLDFGYNSANQIAWTTRSNDLYAWTGHGSGTTSTTADGLNRIEGWNNVLGYDAKGNVISDGTYSYTYSAENLLTSLTNPAPGAVQSFSSYGYDPLMRLAVIDSSNAQLDAHLGHDGHEIVLEGLSGGLTRRYVFGPSTDEPLVSYLVTPTGTTRSFFHADERGSILAQSYDGGGLPNIIGKFDEYGVGTGSSRFHYTGQYWLADRDLHYYRARIYDPRLGRFLQPDPIGYGGGMNMYAYVMGDPINFTDPLGLDGRCGAGQHWERNPTGSRIPQCVNNGGGLAGGLSPGSSLAFGGGGGGMSGAVYSPGKPGSVTSIGNSIIVTAGTPGQWINIGSFSGSHGPMLAAASCWPPVECVRDLRDAFVRLQKKPDEPFKGEKKQRFAKAAGFLQGLSDSQAGLSQIPDGKTTARNLIKAGFTQKDAYDWAVFYSVTYERNHNNISAFYRMEVLRGALRGWPGR
jgi:RHS repeat-associated protein